MPKQIRFEGQLHSFPDDFTDADIQQALGSLSPKPSGPSQLSTVPGARPGPPKPPLPAGLTGKTPPLDPTASGWTNYRRGALTGPGGAVGGLTGQILDMPRKGIEQIEGGVQQIGSAWRPNLPGQQPTPGRNIAGGTSKIIRGAGEAAAPLALPIAAATAPVPTAIALGTGAVAGFGAEKGAQRLGLAPEYAALAGDLANIVAGGLGPKAVGALVSRLKLQPNLSAAAAEAVKFADEQGIPLSAAARSGIERIRKWQAKSAGSTAAGRAQAATQEALRSTGERIRGGPAVTRERAGAGVAEELRATKERYSKGADVAYTELRDIEAADEQDVVVGMRRVDTGVDDYRTNKRIFREEPITERIGLPVDMTAAKTAFAPLVERLANEMPLTQQQASTGLQALQNVLKGPDKVSATTADAFLGTIKTILRERNVTPRSRYLLRQSLDALEPAVNDAVARGGPRAVEALAEGRQLTRAKYAVEQSMKGLRIPKADEFPLEPVKLFRKLTAAEDINAGMLRKVQTHAPDSMPAVGRAYFQGLFDQALDPNGKLDVAAAVRGWRRLGDQSKSILLTPQQVRAADNFFNLLELESETPRTGAVSGAPPGGDAATRILNVLMTLGPEVVGLFTHHTREGMLAGGGYLALRGGMRAVRGGKALFSRGLARALWDPESARTLTEGIRTPTVSAPGAAAAASVRGATAGAPSATFGAPRGPRAARGRSLVPAMAEAIKAHEGWGTGSRSQRNNNPGNLKVLPNQHLPGMIGRDPDGFAIFKNYDAGYQALVGQIERNIGRGMNLQQFFASYAPASDRNRPLEYAQTVGAQLGIDPRTRLAELR